MRRKKALKLKKKIKSSVLSHKGPYLTSVRAINLWFKYLNRALFNNQLPPFNKIILKKWLKRAVGQVCLYPDKNPTRFDLEMLRKYDSKKDFVDTLAHEMVHLYQMSCRKDSGNHNKLFYSFKPKLKFIGLTL